MHIKFYFYFTIFNLLIFSSLNSAVLYHPELKWHTIETGHFYIHYYEGEEETLQIIANYAEYVHRLLSEKYRWTPSGKTHIVVSETEDFANGMATVFPYNTIYIYLIPPEVDSVIGYYDDWLFLLMVHEYTHIIQLDQARGLARVWRSIFGRSPFVLLPPWTTFPNALMPQWLIEGLATYEESKNTTAGRVKSTLMQTMMESVVKENKLPGIGKGSGDVIEWPWHSFPYFYGGRFYEFLSENFGEGVIPSFHEKYSSQPIPLMLNSTSSKVTGAPITLLWLMWQGEEKERFGGASVVKDETEQEMPLTRSGYFTRGVRCSRDGRYLIYTKINPSEYPSVYLYNTETKREKRLFFRNYGIDASWSSDSDGFYFTQAEMYSSFYIYRDLYYFSIKEDRLIKITDRMRLTEFDIAPDGKRGVGIIVKNGKRTLVLIDLKTQTVSEIAEGQWNQGAYNPRFSPEGNKIVFTEWSNYGFYEINYIDLLSRNMVSIPVPSAFNIFPVWGNDGTKIYFSSDMNGRQNLYYYSLKEDRFFKLKDIGRGIYEFDISPDGRKLYFTGYSAEGFDIYEMELNENSWEEIDIAKIEDRAVLEKDIPDAEILKESRYHGIGYIYPRFWMPIIFYDSTDGLYFTIMTQNSDPLQRHSYTLTTEYYAEYNLAGVDFEYYNDVLRPTIGIRYSYSPVRFSDITTGESYWWRKNSGKIFVNHLFKKFRYRLEAGAHYIIKKYTSIDSPEYFYYSAGAGLTLLVDSSKKYSLTPVRQDGGIIGIGVRRYMKIRGSGIEFYKATIDFREYLTLRGNYVLSMSLASGFIWDGLPYEIFSIGGVLPRREYTLFGLDENQLSLRGYPPDVDFGLRCIVATLEFRFPLALLDAGLSTLPIFFQKIHASIFYDSGNAWNDTLSIGDFRDSAGIEIKFDSTAFYSYNITLAIGGAYGFKEGGLFEYFITFGSSF